MAAPARRDGRDARVDGTLGGEVAELAVHVRLSRLTARVQIVRERDGLDGDLGRLTGLPRSALHEREAAEGEHAGEAADQPMRFHSKVWS